MANNDSSFKNNKNKIHDESIENKTLVKKVKFSESSKSEERKKNMNNLKNFEEKNSNNFFSILMK